MDGAMLEGDAPPSTMQELVAPPLMNFTSATVILTPTLREDLVEVFAAVARRGLGQAPLAPGLTKYERSQIRARQLFADARFHDVDPEDFLSALTRFAVTSLKELPPGVLDRLYSAASGKNRLSASQLEYLRAHAKFALYSLWAAKKIVLPITFRLSSSLPRPELHGIATEVALFCLTFPEEGSAGSTAFRMSQHVPRWLVCTAWHTPEDISVSDAIALNRFLLACNKGTVGFPVSSCATSVGLFLSECLKAFPDRIKYTLDDLRRFDLAFGMRLGMVPDLDTVDSAAAAHIKQRRAAKKLADQERLKRKKSLADRRPPPPPEPAETTADYLIYEMKYERVEWFRDVSRLSFLRQRLSDEATKVWSGLFQRYLDYRTGMRGFEAIEPIQASLRVLADYLNVCIPVSYHELGFDGPIPSCPREFTRFPYIDDKGQGEGNTPTFLEYVGQRFSNESGYSRINHARLFFEYIEANYGDKASSDIAGPDFRNPIVQSFDMPRQKGARLRKTNKKPFSRAVVPHLLHWLYIVERFGIHLQDIGPTDSLLGSIVKLSAFDFDARYSHMGVKYKVLEFPSRLVRPMPGSTRPSLSILRMMILALETGLRMQGAQWLCRNKFDLKNKGLLERDFYVLTVNTDKTNDGFIMPILPRVRRFLLREEADQLSYGLEDVEIFYEHRRHTRFEKIVPLFRNVETNAPFVDKTYASYWNLVMEAFHTHFKPIGNVPFIRFVRPRYPKVERTKEGFEYTRLKLQPLYTPHSCRSTFVTRRTPFITLDDIKNLVGHGDTIVTAYYNHPEYGELAAKLLHADQAMWAEEAPGARVTSGPAFIKAKALNSALMTSFGRDRDDTIRRFGMMALQPGLDADAENASALELLRASPMSQIIFRETHICPVGENCPAEVVAEVGSNRRCGICPLACKSLDHLPAIAAKQRQLLERVKVSRDSYARLAAMGDQGSELAELYDAADADFQEYLGWRLSEEILEDIRKHSSVDADTVHVTRPEIVRRHLTRVVKPSTQQEFVLRRIVEANEYPSMATPELRLQALRMTQRLMAGIITADQLLEAEGSSEDEIVGFARLVTTVMKAHDISLEQLAERMARPLPDRRSAKLLLAAET